jgi:hypothetical protein
MSEPPLKRKKPNTTPVPPDILQNRHLDPQADGTCV